MRKEEALSFIALAAVAVVGGMGMQAAQKYLSEDWREVTECRATYWSCESQVAGEAKIAVNGRVASFFGEAKACNEYRAFKRAVDRASFECKMSRNVVPGTCEELETDCHLPGKDY